MNHLLLGALYQEAGGEETKAGFTGQYACFVRDAYHVSELLQTVDQKADPALQPAVDNFYRLTGECGMVFQLGGSSGSLKEQAGTEKLMPDDPRLAMMEDMQGQLSRSLQEMILHSGGNMELMRAGFSLQNHFMESILVFRNLAAENAARGSSSADPAPEAAAGAKEEPPVVTEATAAAETAAEVQQGVDTAEEEQRADTAPEEADAAGEETASESADTQETAEEAEDDPDDIRPLLRKILQSNEYFGSSSLGEVMFNILSLPDDVLPESVELGGARRYLAEELQNIQGKAFDCAEDTLFLFAPDEEGKIRYLNREEIDDLGTRYLDLNADLMDLTDAVNECGISDFPVDDVEQIRKIISGFTTDFFNASAFILRYAEKHEKSTVRPFSVYELLGAPLPEAGGGLLRLGRKLQEQAGEIGDSEAAEAVSAVCEEVMELTGENVPEWIRVRTGGRLFDPLSREELHELLGFYTEKEEHLGEYLRDVMPQKDVMTVAEVHFVELVAEIRERIRRISELLAMLEENERGDRLLGDIGQFVEYELTRRQEEKKGGNPVPSRYDPAEAGYLIYAINCKQMADHDALLASFLLEDPQDRHAVDLLSLQFNQKSLEEVNRWEEEDISGIPWVNGMRDLSAVPRYKARLEELEEPLHILQYATKNDWDGMMEVLDASLKNPPVYMKKLIVMIGKNAGSGVPSEIDVCELLRAELEIWREEGGTVQDYWTESGGPSGVVQRMPAFAGFANPQDEARVSGFLKHLERNLENAGLGREAQQALSDSHIPNGYNEAAAREWTNELFGNLDHSIRHNLMEDEKIALLRDRSNNERYMNVTVSFARLNADAEKSENHDFYTTAADFRVSQFVGGFRNIERNMEMIRLSVEDLGDEEVAEVFSAERKKHFGYVMDQRIDQARTVVQRVAEDVLFQMGQSMETYGDDDALTSRSAFEDAASIEAIADQQVIDYLTGVRLRHPDDLRLGFHLEDGKIAFSGIGAADRADARPFTLLIPEEEERRLVQPENMLVMSKEMYEKLLRWKKGLEDPKRSRLSEVEKAIFDAMDPEVERGFERRLIHVLRVTEDPQSAIYEDRKHRLLGNAFPPDVKAGSIRVVDKEMMELLRMEDLRLGERSGMSAEQARNLFDTLGGLAQRCSDALLDKGIAALVGAAEKGFGEGLGWLGEVMYREQKKTYDLSMNNHLAERLCLNVARFYGDTALIAEESRQKESAMLRFLGDGMVVQGVAEAAEEMRDEILKNRRMAADEKLLSGKGEDSFDRERLEEIRTFREERLRHAQSLADAQGHAYPEELPAITRDPNLFFRSLEAMEKFSSRLRGYLEKRRLSVNETGKERYNAMLELFNRTNRAIAAYASLTGDTTFMPQKGEIPADKPTAAAVFSDLFASKADYEMTTPYYYETDLKKKELARSVRHGSDSAGGRAAAGREDGAKGAPSPDRSGGQGRRMVSLNALMNEGKK